ncbi:hypothetical protein EPN81_02670 [Patescibacteria group bacterium]|nr:MAG: hypothetical protein EPN81_02670 [Patescibacteria group bacterium]
MKYLAVVEIPKGSDRRVHLSYDGSGFKDFGPIKERIPVNEGVMPVHYGYIKNVINPVENDNVDVIIFSNAAYETGDETNVEIIGMLTRKDGDHKLIAADESIVLAHFSEVPAQDKNLLLEYFGYKSEIVSIDSREDALAYLQTCMASA